MLSNITVLCNKPNTIHALYNSLMKSLLNSNRVVLVNPETSTECLIQAKQRCNMNQRQKFNGSKEARDSGE